MESGKIVNRWVIKSILTDDSADVLKDSATSTDRIVSNGEEALQCQKNAS